MGNCGLIGKKAPAPEAPPPEEKDREVEVPAGETSTPAEEVTKEAEVSVEAATTTEIVSTEPTPVVAAPPPA